MKFFIKRSKKELKMKQIGNTSALNAESVQLVIGGTGGDGAQPRMQSFSPKTKPIFFGG